MTGSTLPLSPTPDRCELVFADDVSAADRTQVLGQLLPVYRALEARLLKGEPAASLLYTIRIPSLAEGLIVLGVPVPAGDRTIPALEHEAARWGGN